jgi:hypothetical protein
MAGSFLVKRRRLDHERNTEKTQKQPRASGRRLFYASQAVQLEDIPLILSINPVVYLVKEINACIREASGLVLLGIRIERCVVGVK